MSFEKGSKKHLFRQVYPYFFECLNRQLVRRKLECRSYRELLSISCQAESTQTQNARSELLSSFMGFRLLDVVTTDEIASFRRFLI